MFIKIFLEELSDMWSVKYIFGVEETEKTGRVGVGDFSSANKHEPLDASDGARIMVKEVGVVFLMFLSTMKLAPQLQSKAAINYNDWQNMK